MKALVKARAGTGLELANVPVPEVGINDVLIKILKTSICGTDVHIWDWDAWAQRHIHAPMTIGHEFVGVVERVGDNVRDYKPGTRVSGEGHLVCGHCRNCLAGRRHLCARPSCVGVDRDGAFAEYLCIPVANVWPADPNIPLDVTSCFDPLGNATHTALAFDVLGEDVLITGAGPVGLMASAIVRHAGARHVVVTDINPYRIKLARKMGATLALDARTQTVEDAQKQLEMKEGFDVALEMSGSPDAFRSILANLSHGGRVALLGILPQASIDWDTVIVNGLTIQGIYGRRMFETWYKMTVMIQSGLDITPVITHRFHHTEFENAFELMRSHRSGKVILDWAGA